MVLYIPLCFYYIPVRHLITIHIFDFTFHYASTISVADARGGENGVTLHSTMLQLYPEPPKDKSGCVPKLYIPLCFYYISSGITATAEPIFTLHSTMLLLYPKEQAIQSVETAFTFHYASTISIFHLICIRLRFHFTFHYASTISL